MGTIIFNGISSKDLGIVVQTHPTYEFSGKDYDVTHIHGRNGDIVVGKGSYQNIERSYVLASAFRPNTSYIDNVTAISAWLTSANGYAKLQDSYEPNYYRKALFREAGKMPNLNDKATEIKVVFECKPQRFLLTGEDQVTFNTATHDVFHKITNPTSFIALPEIKVTDGFTSIEVVSGEDPNNPVNKTVITLEVTTPPITDTITIDSEIQDVFTESKFINSKVSMTNGFPKLFPGTNWIKVNYAISSAKTYVRPRWWVL